METWISIAEYAKKYSMSVSTVRRKLKNNELEYVKDKGRYYINALPIDSTKTNASNTIYDLVVTQKDLILEKNRRIEELEGILKAKEEEIAELQMLVSVLEEGK